MEFEETHLKGSFVITPKVFKDSRGYFFESFRDDLFKKYIGKVNFIQDNESFSVKNTIRGMHFQIPPFAQAQLVRVTKGSVIDIIVDIRRNSPTFGKSFKIILSDENKKQLFMPVGFAHGFLALTEEVIFSYKVDNFYSFEHDRCFNCEDKFLNLEWGASNSEYIYSPKDKIAPLFNSEIQNEFF